MSNPTDPRKTMPETTSTNHRIEIIKILSKARAELAYTFYQPEIERVFNPSEIKNLDKLLDDLICIRDELNAT